MHPAPGVEAGLEEDMTYKHLLVHVDGGERSEERLALAVNLARRWKARLTGLFAEGQDWGRPSVARSKPQPYAKALKAAAARFQSRVREAGLDSEWWHVADREMDVGGIAARFCRYADLAILGQSDPEEGRVPLDFADQVMLESARPVLLVPSVGAYPDSGRRVLVAWNGSREDARALNDAIPMMHEAEQVLVADLKTSGRGKDENQADILRHLAAHGIVATRERVVLPKEEVRKTGVDALNTLLNMSSDFGADLVVMGARGRHGVPFPRAGRSTRKSLQTMLAPLLLSH
jgi:nucleotide-binding universal stress UspA family protein